MAIEAQANGLATIVSDNVPDDVLISPFCDKLDLADGADRWAEHVRMTMDKTKEADRMTGGQYVKSAGYEIQIVADEIQRFYENLPRTGMRKK